MRFEFLLSSSLVLLTGTIGQATDDAIRFNRDVRAILSSKCFTCHGPDVASREADLRLDTEEGIRTVFSGGLKKSAAWERIQSNDEFMKMPPPDSHLKLEPSEIEILQKWIAAGAKWEGHWSFIPPVKPPVPDVEHAEAVRNPIDAYIIARLEREGLKPSPEADRALLLRRVSLDLTGLPPSIQDMDAFVKDPSEDAYERAVDRLLASQEFGERMAVMWMDAARYGDTSVFHADGPRDMWPWRDWVINSYNSNKSFKDFTVEQLAGDLLPNPTLEQKVATAFLRNNATTDEGGAIAEEYRVEYAVDRVKTTSMVWLGLSMECAQCHDHKYDPISQKEYYRFFAYFNQAADPGMQTRKGNQTPKVDLFDDVKLAEAGKLKPKKEALVKQREQYAAEVQPKFESWLAEASKQAGETPVLPGGMAFHSSLDNAADNLVVEKTTGKIHGPTKWAEGKSGQAFDCNGSNYIGFDGVGDFERTDQFSYGAWIKPNGNPTGAPIARMNDGNGHRGFDLHIAGGVAQIHLINTWPSNSLKVRTKGKLKPNEWRHVFVTYDGSSKASGVKVYFDGKLQKLDVEQDRLSGTIRTKVPLYLGRRNPGSAYKGLIDDVRIYPRTLSESEVAALAGSDPITPLLVKNADERTDAERKTLKQHYLTSVDKTYQKLTADVAALDAKIGQLSKPIVDVMVMQDVAKMRPTFVLDRGNYSSPKKDEPLQPGTPSMLPPLPEGVSANRLGLAQWLTHPRHPLTARVTVNRYWSMLFGRGLVKTLADFGAQGDWPTHPALLDWLAVDFVESGWDIKRMLKMMVMSATYRQSTRVTPELLRADPENKLLARGPRFRLQAEFIRDNALAASGLLVKEVGGAGVKPYQPPGLWNEVSLSGNVRFVQDHGSDLYRRSLYTYWKRSAPAPAMTIFDSPTREKCSLERSRTNTPLQALVTLNDTQFVEAARVLAERAMHEGGDSVDEQIVYAFRLATGVRPTDSVLKLLQDTYEEEFATFTSENERATKLLAVGEAPRDEKLSPAEHAAMTIVTSMILNLDQTVTRG
ncbi:DUF1553 domain-containing protein [Thalassoroseus pseudoceratinae]|uniref:DUF1553 domain-containing protein n=1 Tax=Thalassoroseus pseudoceratinae TaxID=2713176 RepID=UPI00141DB527|nr:DUF1553 domain-containing protein [Thalassoroseus pseudoceratinae]